MPEEKKTGVEKPAVAGQEEEIDISKYFEDDPEDAEETKEGAPEGDPQQHTGEDEELPPEAEKAFARRLAAKEEQIRKEYDQKYSAQQHPQRQQQGVPGPGDQKVGPPPRQQQQAPQQQPALSKEQIDKLAEDLALTPEAVNVLYNQQMAISQQDSRIREQQEYLENLRDESTKAETRTEIEAQRKENPSLPEFDEERVKEMRKQYKDQYGVNLPWKEAYRQLVAEEAMTGNLSRNVQQQTIQQVADRGGVNTQIGKGGKSASKPDLWDLSSDQFSKVKEQALQGKLKKG